MKKIIIALMICAVMFTLVSCGTNVTTKDDLSDYLQIDVSITSEKIGDETFYFDYLDSETVAITNYEGSDVPHKVTIPTKLNNKTVTGIATEAFKYKSSITEVEIAETITTIGEYAFRDCAALSTITIPSTIKSIGVGAFYGCTGLKTLTIADGGIAKISAYAFMRCSSLETVSIPATITAIDDAAFFECSKLTTVVFAEGIKTIGKQAFQNCESLADITFAASIEEIGEQAFAGSKALYLEGIHFASTADETNKTLIKDAVNYGGLTNKPVENPPE